MTDILGSFFELLAHSSPWRGYVQDVWVLVLLVASFIWGGGPEKACITIWALVFSTSAAIREFVAENTGLSPYYLSDIYLPSFAGDLVVLIGFVGLALYANRQYVFWLAAWQIIAVMAHVVRGMDEAISPFTYVFMTAGPGWMQVWIMTGALIVHMRREPGRFADWRWQVETAREELPA